MLGYSVQTDLITVSISSLVNMHCCLSSLSITMSFITSTSACKLIDTLEIDTIDTSFVYSDFRNFWGCQWRRPRRN